MTRALACCALILAACAGHWSKPNASGSEYIADKTECVRYAREMAQQSHRCNPDNGPCSIGEGTANIGIALAQRRYFAECMEAKGWSK